MWSGVSSRAWSRLSVVGLPQPELLMIAPDSSRTFQEGRNSLWVVLNEKADMLLQNLHRSRSIDVNLRIWQFCVVRSNSIPQNKKLLCNVLLEKKLRIVSLKRELNVYFIHFSKTYGMSVPFHKLLKKTLKRNELHLWSWKNYSLVTKKWKRSSVCTDQCPFTNAVTAIPTMTYSSTYIPKPNQYLWLCRDLNARLQKRKMSVLILLWIYFIRSLNLFWKHRSVWGILTLLAFTGKFVSGEGGNGDRN